MFNKCLYLKIRHKKGQLYYYCTKLRKIVSKSCYIGCFEKEYKKYKRLKPKSQKQKELENNRYSIIQDDLSKCYFCGKKSQDWHELIKGTCRKKCIKYGLCIKVCRNCHRRTEEDTGFYKDTRKMAQKKWQEYYNKTEDEFIKEFGRSWL